MAALQHRNGSYRVIFRYHGKQQSFTLGGVSQEEAEKKSALVDYLLLRLEQRLATLPPGIGIVEYLQFDGKPKETDTPDKLSLAAFRDRYLETHENSLEATTVEGIRLHFKHLVGQLGPAFPVAELSLAELQDYVNRRAKASGTNGRTLSSATIKKEIVTLRTAWNWAAKMKMVSGRFPYDGLRYPKSTEKPPFMTRAEIKRQIAGGGLTAAEQADLWDALYLELSDIGELLAHVKANAGQPFVYPMVCFAAHTGARRSEILRTRVIDLDLKSKSVTIHERKRVKGRATTRRVPLSPVLIEVLEAWLSIHPGGPMLFCHQPIVERSNKRSTRTGYKDHKARPKTVAGRLAILQPRPRAALGPLTPDEAHDHLKRSLAKSDWEHLRGWHTLRHSFISALASKGVDQRLIDEFVGHQSEEQRRRYRHLYPSVKQEAIALVFGDKPAKATGYRSNSSPRSRSIASRSKTEST